MQAGKDMHQAANELAQSTPVPHAATNAGMNLAETDTPAATADLLKQKAMEGWIKGAHSINNAGPYVLAALMVNHKVVETDTPAILAELDDEAGIGKGFLTDLLEVLIAELESIDHLNILSAQLSKLMEKIPKDSGIHSAVLERTVKLFQLIQQRKQAISLDYSFDAAGLDLPKVKEPGEERGSYRSLETVC